MNCMRCGTQIPENQVFCDRCLSKMDAYPVKPGAHIHLPKRALAVEEPRKPAKKKRTLTQEEQIAALKLKVLRLRLAAAILAFVICVVGAFLALELYEDYTNPATGLNYTVDTSMND